MRRIARTPLPWDLIPAASPRQASATQICLACQYGKVQQRPSRNSFSTSTRTHASDDVSFLERTRRRMWGTDQPPGAKDPYTREPKQGKSERSQNLLEEGTTADLDDVRTYEARALKEEKELFQAAVEDAPNHEGYVPAQTWDGLETVGGEKEWNSGKVFNGFLPLVKLATPEEITVAIHRAAVEVFAALATSRPLKKLPYPQPGALVDATTGVQIVPTADGLGAVLEFPSAQVMQAILQSSPSASGSTTIEVPGLAQAVLEPTEEATSEAVQEPEFISSPQVYTTESLKQNIDSWGRGWLHLSLMHPVIKFAIVRRVVQLTGLRVPDHLIHKTESLGFLVAHLAKPPPAKTLYQVLAADEKLAGLSNVTIAPRRVTPVDKEKQVGRWKLIEQELRRRDLPVLGHR